MYHSTHGDTLFVTYTLTHHDHSIPHRQHINEGLVTSHTLLYLPGDNICSATGTPFCKHAPSNKERAYHEASAASHCTCALAWADPIFGTYTVRLLGKVSFEYSNL